MKTKPEINGCRILKHGLRSPAGKYHPAWFSRFVSVTGIDAITVYAKSILIGLPRELGNVTNGTESQSDHYEEDIARFVAGTPEFEKLLPFCRH
jgi:hypothetical protein